MHVFCKRPVIVEILTRTFVSRKYASEQAHRVLISTQYNITRHYRMRTQGESFNGIRVICGDWEIILFKTRIRQVIDSTCERLQKSPKNHFLDVQIYDTYTTRE